MAIDWTDTGYSSDISVLVVSQTNVNNTLGSLSGVQLSNMTVTEGYYSDSRVSAKVTTMVAESESDGYVDQARLRIVLSIPEKDFSEELITGFVSDINEEHNRGYVTRTYSVEGNIWGLLNHKTNAPITIGKGAKLVDIWSSLLGSLTKLQYTTEGAQDHSFGSTVLYEAGSDLSTVLFEISEGYSRMDTDGHGRVTLKKYIAPKNRYPERLIDYNSLSSLSMLPLSRDDTSWEAPGRAVVTATISHTSDNGESTQEVIVGSYDSPKDNPTSIEKRGYLLGRTDSYSGNSEKPSKSELDALAKKNWESSQDKGITWEGSSVFADYHAGEIATLISPVDGSSNAPVESHKVLVQSVTTNLGTMVQDLTLKEV